MDTTEAVSKLASVDSCRAHRPHPAGNPVATTEASTKFYRDLSAVDGISLQIPQGGAYGFLGPNGAGKSTTMKLLLGLMKSTSGRMSALGYLVGTGSPLPAGAIGSLIEGSSYYPSLSGRGNLMMFVDYLGLLETRVQHTLETVDLADQESELVKRYSTGMRQCLGLTIALLADPRLILPNEPTNGLGPAGVTEIRQLIVALTRQEGVIVIVSSHILSEIEQMADSVGIICAGRLRYQGPLSGSWDEGVIEPTAAGPVGIFALLRAHRIRHRIIGGVTRTPMLPDSFVGDLIARIVQAGQTLFRVQTVRKNLEQTFLELADSLAGWEMQ